MNLDELSILYYSDKVGEAPLNPMFVEVCGPDGNQLKRPVTSVTLKVEPCMPAKVVAIEFDDEE